MKIIHLPEGQVAGEDCDCITIQRTPEGAYTLTGSVLVQCSDGDEATSESIVSGPPYGSYDEAESAGLAWAAEHCPVVLHVVRSHGAAPLPDIFENPADAR